MSEDLVVGKLVIPAATLSWTAVRASGPGGQNVNKVASKVELRFDLEACAVLSAAARDRLRNLAANRLDREGQVLIVSQKTRDQRKNLEDARDHLRDLIAQALIVPKKRRPTKPSKSSQRRRVEEKKKRGTTKASRQYRSSDD